MADLGMGPDDATFALGANSQGSVMAARFLGWSAADVEQDLLPVLIGDMADPQQAPTIVADRAVIKVTDGPDVGDTGGLYITTSDDVIWTITADEPALSESSSRCRCRLHRPRHRAQDLELSAGGPRPARRSDRGGHRDPRGHHPIRVAYDGRGVREVRAGTRWTTTPGGQPPGVSSLAGARVSRGG